MSKTFAFLAATSLAATSATTALAGGLDDAIIEAPVVVEPAPAVGGLGGLGTVGAIAGGLVALGVIAAVIDDDDDDDAAETTLTAEGATVEIQ